MKRLNMPILQTILFAAISIGSTFTASAYSGEVFVVCRLNPAGDNYLSLRSCGSTRCREMRRLGPGTYLISLEPYAVKRWREVMVRRHANDDSHRGPSGWVSGPSGWVYDKYICRVRASQPPGEQYK